MLAGDTTSGMPPVVHSPEPRPRVAVVYHFFAHYRKAVVERLARSRVATFTFFGDDHDYEAPIKCGSFSPLVDLRPCPTHQIRGSWMWQGGVIGVAASKSFDQVILLANAYWVATWIAAIVGRLTGKRVIFWSHGFLSPPTGVKGWFRRMFFGLAHAHLFYGRTANRHAIAIGWDPTRIHAVHNCLDLDHQRAARATIDARATAACRTALFKDPALPTVICSCRLVPGKKLGLLIEALAVFKREGVGVNMIIIGDGPDRQRLERLAHDADLSAHFEGACYNEERIALLTMSSDLTVCPGFIGLTAMHSMVYGVPVISNRSSSTTAPEVEAIVPGRTGDLFADGNVDDLVRVMRPWIATRSDRETVRTECIAMVERYWSPDYQLAIIERAVLGRPADDGDYPWSAA